MTVNIIVVGKKTDPLIQAAVDMYQKRLSSFTRLEWQFVAPSRLKDTKQKIIDEGCGILCKIDPQSYVVLLDERGLMMDNMQLAKLIHSQQNDGRSSYTFIIGGSHGVSKTVKQSSQIIWSLSALVFPHQLVRLILVEQLYRTATILQNHPYHH